MYFSLLLLKISPFFLPLFAMGFITVVILGLKYALCLFKFSQHLHSHHPDIADEIFDPIKRSFERGLKNNRALYNEKLPKDDLELQILVEKAKKASMQFGYSFALLAAFFFVNVIIIVCSKG